MKNVLFSLLSASFSICCLGQHDNNITIGIIDSVQSTILHEKRKVWVYLPNGQQTVTKQTYPVVYLLDGDGHFHSVVGMIQQLSQVNGNTICPEMIVVGIPNTDRTRDLTPTHVDIDPPLTDSAFFKTSGGGENFVAFIEHELIPHIDSSYPTQPYRMLIGHSFGGLTVMNIVLNHTKLFNAYISIDPSMSWDNMNLLKATKKLYKEKHFPGTTLYLAFANTMEDGIDMTNVEKDTSFLTRHIRSIIDLDRTMLSNRKNGLRYQSKYYDLEDHGSVPLIAEYDGFRFIFEKYRYKFLAKDYLDSTEDLPTKIEKHFQDVSKLFGYRFAPPENLVNELGYVFIQQKHYKKSDRFFRMNIENYPESPNAYNSYGDYFLAIGDQARAADQFKKALSLKEDPEIRKKLNELPK